LVLTAISIGFVHTLIGPDHYLPFVAMSAARNWTRRKTLLVTAACGVGHVLGSIVLGLVGIAIGAALHRLEWIEGVRGDLAAWALTAFGLVYMAWGLRRAWRDREHSHEHVHSDGTRHRHTHAHHTRDEHLHVHVQVDTDNVRSLTPWALFIVFILGPCEALIPLLMYPASQHSWWGVSLVVIAFAVTTILTMLTIVYLAVRGLERLPLKAAERYTHALAGAALSVCGLGIVFGL
ncbi:MAG TPA: sulfite exporter TauE/SafE family protein, partial [Steroidobacteraceae bacterium]|nr:sulfite exporter TauE/SafE family protein [Steroidobacteraceae bacterium]